MRSSKKNSVFKKSNYFFSKEFTKIIEKPKKLKKQGQKRENTEKIKKNKIRFFGFFNRKSNK